MITGNEERQRRQGNKIEKEDREQRQGTKIEYQDKEPIQGLKAGKRRQGEKTGSEDR